MGEPAACAPQFSYTAALRDSKLAWDAATLRSRFLAAPTSVVPGTAMVLAVPDETDRANLIAYFQSVSESLGLGPKASIVVPASRGPNRRIGDCMCPSPLAPHQRKLTALSGFASTLVLGNSSSVVVQARKCLVVGTAGFSHRYFLSGTYGPAQNAVFCVERRHSSHGDARWTGDGAASLVRR